MAHNGNILGNFSFLFYINESKAVFPPAAAFRTLVLRAK